MSPSTPRTAAPTADPEATARAGTPERALAEGLLDALGCERGCEIEALQRLTGGANMETWSFDLVTPGQRRALVLRRRPPGLAAATRSAGGSASSATLSGLPLVTEAALIELARRAGVPVPAVLARTEAPHALGDALVMTRVTGSALPRRVLEEPRPRLAFQCGEALARLHSVALDEVPAGLRDLPWAADLDRLQALCDHFGNPSPAHQLAINWLRDQPAPTGPRVLCHGDFRTGNLLVGDAGLTAVLDWELAHIGYAGEDLGYLCANVWRFGSPRPVGGFGDYRELLDGYRSVSGTAPSPGELRRWELYAALGWGLVCLTMLELHRSGVDPGLERAAVGRRVSESEIDILLLLEDLAA